MRKRVSGPNTQHARPLGSDGQWMAACCPRCQDRCQGPARLASLPRRAAEYLGPGRTPPKIMFVPRILLLFSVIRSNIDCTGIFILATRITVQYAKLQRGAAACRRLFQQTTCSCLPSAERCHRHAQYVCSPQTLFVAFVRLSCTLVVGVLRCCRSCSAECWNMFSSLLLLLSSTHRQLVTCAPPVTCRCGPAIPRPHTRVQTVHLSCTKAALLSSPPRNSRTVPVMSDASGPFSFR